MSTQTIAPETPTETGSETAAEAKARRAVHVVGATIIAVVVIIIVFSFFGGARWAKGRQMHAIQMAARADLQLVADAEAAFFKLHGFYTTDLKALNLWPKRVLYGFGFVKSASFPEATTNEWNPDRRTITRLASERSFDAIAKAKADPNFRPDPPIVLSPLTDVARIDYDRLASYCPDCTATKTTFKVVAAAQLDEDPVLDIWTLDEKGNIQHLIDDLK